MTDATEADGDYQGRQVEDFPVMPGAYERIHEPHNDGVWMIKMHEDQAQGLVDYLREQYENVE